ncbi:nucleic-acid-binding protein from transposon X-element [Nephila pilipes]|uniref:Nucleic-acid-binding protein from transposon X-element n=1 Tax=Nephila pilipes TaxID=299642 RepID=A0A8X6MFU3_NEPPI|nr:nucleic-acid-binding protein from transposon X-element [Nephila pilipes]
MMRITQNYNLILQEINRIAPNTEAVLAPDFIKLLPYRSNNHRAIPSYLREDEIDFYVTNPPSKKHIKIILKGLPTSTDVDEIKTDFESKGFQIEKVAQLRQFKIKKTTTHFYS